MYNRWNLKMNLLFLLSIDDLNYLIQHFLGNLITPLGKYNIKHLVFRPSHNQSISIQEIRECFRASQMCHLRMLDLSFLDILIPYNYSFLSNFTQLSTLDLTCTKINSLDHVYNLINLQSLYLCDCEQIYLIDNQGITNWQNLKTLDLSGTNIIDIPSEIKFLSKLESLDIGGCNKLKDLPESIGQLSQLRKLFINNCEKLVSLPNGMSNLKNLTQLSICYNYSLKFSIQIIEQLTSLEVLNLRGLNNSLFSLDASPLKKLKQLKLTSSKVEFLKLPQQSNNLQTLTVHNCQDLTNLNLNDCLSLEFVTIQICSQLTSIPYQLFNIRNLYFLNLSCHSLRFLPDNFGNLSNLQHLILSDGNFQKLPASISTFINLKILKLLSMNIHELSPEIGHLESLTYFRMDDCRLIKTLPAQLSKLVNLTRLDLINCHSLARIPVNLITLPQLTIFQCHYNNLKIIPTEINHYLTNKHVHLKELSLVSINLNNNSWSPDDFLHLNNLQILDLSYNNFERLPVEIGLLGSLITLKIEGCQNLTMIPNSIFKLQQLEELNLANCQNLTKLPSSIHSKDTLKKLKILNLEYTYLKLAYFDSNYGHNIEYLNLSNTDITHLPESIGMYSYLQELHLSGCRKLSTLPESIGKLKELELLDLEDCTRFQRLPKSIIYLDKLKTINLLQTKCYIDYLPPDFKKKIQFSVASNSDDIDY